MPQQASPRPRKQPFYRRYWHLLIITGLWGVYLVGFPPLSVMDLHRTEVTNFEVIQDNRSQGITLFKEGYGPDIIIKSGETGYHLPARLWAAQFSPDSLLNALQAAGHAILYLGDTRSTNVFGLTAGTVHIPPQTGVTDYNEKRRWFLYLIFALYGAVLLDWIVKRMRQ